MGRKYTQRAEEAIWAMSQAGMNASQIKRNLETGRAGITVPDVKVRTIQHKVQQLKKQRGEPDPVIPPDQEIHQAAEAIAREYLSVAKQQLTRFRAIARERPLTNGESLAYRNITRVVDELRVNGAPTGGGKLRAAKGQERGNGKSALIARLDEGSNGTTASTTDYGKRTPLQQDSATDHALIHVAGQDQATKLDHEADIDNEDRDNEAQPMSHTDACSQLVARLEQVDASSHPASHS